MLTYAADAPRFAERRQSPRALMVIVGAHAVALAVLMTTKMEVPLNPFRGTTVELLPADHIPRENLPPPEPRETLKSQPTETVIDQTRPIVPIDPFGPVALDPPIDLPPAGPVPGTGTTLQPPADIHPPVRVAARFNTPDWSLKPPYPAEMREREVEATLKLRLQIDDRGRVVAVEPVGRADPAFLAAARKHLLANWRYRPATEDGRPVHSSTVITLRFELEA